MYEFTPSAYRARAREALKNNWHIAIIVGLIASLPGLLSTVITTLTDSDFTVRLQTEMIPLIQQGQLYTMTQVKDLFLECMKPLIPFGLIAKFVLFLAEPALLLGLYCYLYALLDGGEADVPMAFARLPQFAKAVGVLFWTGLLIFLWEMPGAVVMTAGTVVTLLSTVSDSAWGWLGVILTFAGMGMMLFLGIRAALHYYLANYILADKPETGVRACVRESVQLMRNRKPILIVLVLSFIGWSLLASVAGTVAAAMAGAVVGNTVNMAGRLLLNVYMSCAVCAFCRDCAAGKVPEMPSRRSRRM